MKRCLLIGVLLAGAANAEEGAEQTVVWADVLNVQPITRTVTQTPETDRCRSPKPSRSAGLAALLAWDLAPACRPTTVEHIEAYEVTYRWGEHRFTDRRLEPPGARIPLRLSFEVQPSDASSGRSFRR